MATLKIRAGVPKGDDGSRLVGVDIPREAPPAPTETAVLHARTRLGDEVEHEPVGDRVPAPKSKARGKGKG